MSFYTIIGLALVILNGYLLIKNLGRNLPILEFMLTLAGLQWIVGAFIDYITIDNHHRYYMHVSEDVYMRITVPCYAVFTFFTLFNRANLNIEIVELKKWCERNSSIIVGLIIIGYLSSFFPGFFFYLLGLLKLIGTCLIVFSLFRFKWIVVLTTFLLSLYQSIISGMFHMLILDSSFMFFTLAIYFRFSLIKKLSFLGVSMVILFFLQTMKLQYREYIWNNTNTDKIALFIDMFTNSVRTDIKEEEQTAVNSRLNQGWIISVIYERYSDEDLEFLGGETILEAIKSSLLPRFLSPNKKGGGGKYTFNRLTDIELGNGTAMGTSLLGEFYGNFGLLGSVFCFSIWGTLLSMISRKFYNLQNNYPFIVFFLILVFYQVVKAESDMLTVLNHLVKSLIVVTIAVFFIKRLQTR